MEFTTDRERARIERATRDRLRYLRAYKKTTGKPGVTDNIRPTRAFQHLVDIGWAKLVERGPNPFHPEVVMYTIHITPAGETVLAEIGETPEMHHNNWPGARV